MRQAFPFAEIEFAEQWRLDRRKLQGVANRTGCFAGTQRIAAVAGADRPRFQMTSERRCLGPSAIGEGQIRALPLETTLDIPGSLAMTHEQ